MLSLRSFFEKVVGKMEGIEERSARRRRIIVGHVAKDFADAERWNLEFWQSQTPEERLSALVAIHEDIEMVHQARLKDSRKAKRTRQA